MSQAPQVTTLLHAAGAGDEAAQRRPGLFAVGLGAQALTPVEIAIGCHLSQALLKLRNPSAQIVQPSVEVRTPQ